MKKIQIIILSIILGLSLLVTLKPITASNFTTQKITTNQKINANSYIPMQAYITTTPISIDGVKDFVWQDAGYQTLTFTNGSSSVQVKFYVLHDENYLYYALQYHDPTFTSSGSIDTANIMMDMNTTATFWNQISSNAAVDDFDVTTATWVLGTNTSYALDRYSYNGAFYQDVNVGGTNNTITGGSYDYETHTYFYELSQELHSTDIKHDINVKVGEHILIWPYVYIDGSAYSYENFGNLTIESQKFPYNTPEITIQSPQLDSTTYNRNVPVIFTVNLRTSWIGYSLDFQTNITVTGNFLMNLIADGTHSLVIYANSSFNKMGKSMLLNFTVNSQPNTDTITTFPVYNTATPISIDGVKDSVWQEAGYHMLTLSNGSSSIPVDFSVLHDAMYLYFSFQYHDPTFISSGSLDDAQVMLDMNKSTTFWNQIGTNVDTFDVVTASWVLGTNTSYAIDRYSYNANFYQDVNDGGTVDTHTGGSYNLSSQTYFYEISQPLNSSDNLHDISLQIGDHALIIPSVLIDGSYFNYEKIGNLIIESGEYPIQNTTIPTTSSNTTSSVTSYSRTSSSSSVPGYTEVMLFATFIVILINKRRNNS